MNSTSLRSSPPGWQVKQDQLEGNKATLSLPGLLRAFLAGRGGLLGAMAAWGRSGASSDVALLGRARLTWGCLDASGPLTPFRAEIADGAGSTPAGDGLGAVSASSVTRRDPSLGVARNSRAVARVGDQFARPDVPESGRGSGEFTSVGGLPDNVPGPGQRDPAGSAARHAGGPGVAYRQLVPRLDPSGSWRVGGGDRRFPGRQPRVRRPLPRVGGCCGSWLPTAPPCLALGSSNS